MSYSNGSYFPGLHPFDGYVGKQWYRGQSDDGTFPSYGECSINDSKYDISIPMASVSEIRERLKKKMESNQVE